MYMPLYSYSFMNAAFIKNNSLKTSKATNLAAIENLVILHSDLFKVYRNNCSKNVKKAFYY